MKNKGKILITNAMIWGALTVATALDLKGSGYSDRMLTIVGLGFVASNATIALFGRD